MRRLAALASLALVGACTTVEYGLNVIHGCCAPANPYQLVWYHPNEGGTIGYGARGLTLAECTERAREMRAGQTNPAFNATCIRDR